MIKVSKRLKAIGDLVPDGSVLVDIGTDHALLLIYLIKQSKITHGYGVDIAKKPLSIAKTNVNQYNLGDKITLIQSDGLRKFNQQANVYVIAGMGAENIWEIIKDYSFDQNDCVILQANSKQAYLREKLSKNYFEIIDESFILDMKRFYTLIKVKPSEHLVLLSRSEQLLGPILIKQQNLLYINQIKQRQKYLLQYKKFNHELKEEYTIINDFLKGAS